MSQGPVFLERKSYRRRRMQDALRLLPFLGLLLCMVPLGWPRATVPEAAAAISTSAALQYLFGVWMALVLLGWLLSRRTAGPLEPSNPVPPDEPG